MACHWSKTVARRLDCREFGDTLDNGTNGVARYWPMDPIENLIAEARRRNSLPPAALRRLLRQRAGLTQAELAQALGVERSAVTRYETGAREPRGAIRLAYIKALERLSVASQ